MSHETPDDVNTRIGHLIERVESLERIAGITLLPSQGSTENTAELPPGDYTLPASAVNIRIGEDTEDISWEFDFSQAKPKGASLKDQSARMAAALRNRVAIYGPTNVRANKIFLDAAELFEKITALPPTFPNDKLMVLLLDAWGRMDRARHLITSGKPTPMNNWSILDTSLDRFKIGNSYNEDERIKEVAEKLQEYNHSGADFLEMAFLLCNDYYLTPRRKS